MFNDRYGLTQAVIEGRKTMTRRIEPICKLVQGWIDLGYTRIEVLKNGIVRFHNDKTGTYVEEKTRYAIDEVVAVAQSYNDAGYECIPYRDTDEYLWLLRDGKAVNGVSITPVCETNKMFTRADLMPHQIRITDIRIERLQDISDEDCLREGVRYIKYIDSYYFERTDREEGFYFNTAREAFAALIDKVSGRGTWKSNPYVVVYEFKLVKYRDSRKTSK
jgi:hypothetical protein